MTNETTSEGESSQGQPQITVKAYLSRVRHELRTPLNHILGYCEIVQEETEGQLPESFAANLTRTHAGGKELLRLIGECFNEDTFDPDSVNRDKLVSRLRVPVDQIVECTELLQAQAEEIGQQNLLPDLQKIHTAASNWIALLEQNIEPNAALGSVGIPVVDEKPSADPTAPAEQAQGTLLVVDDDEGNREILSRRLGRQGYTVLTAENGTKALEIARETEELDLVLLDVIMPDLSGYQVLKELKADDELRDIPVIMLSAMDDIDSVVECILLGADDYLSKPFSPVLLKARIGTSLEKRRLALAERELLDKTLNGSVQMLTEVLSLIDPESFGRSQVLLEYMRMVNQSLDLGAPWELEVAAMLSQVGYVTIPPTIVKKIRFGQSLSSTEEHMVSRVVEASSRFLTNIPRLESVAQIILYQNKRFDGLGVPADPIKLDEIPVGSRILRILNGVAEYRDRGIGRSEAFIQMRRREGVYDLNLINTLEPVLGDITTADAKDKEAPKELAVGHKQLRLGDELISDIKTLEGTLVVRAGGIVTELLLEKLKNFADMIGIQEPILIKFKKDPVKEDGVNAKE